MRAYGQKPDVKAKKRAYMKEYYKKGKWSPEKRRKYNREYQREYQKIGRERDRAIAPPKKDKLQPIEIGRMTPEQIISNWDRIG